MRQAISFRYSCVFCMIRMNVSISFEEETRKSIETPITPNCPCCKRVMEQVSE